MPRLLLIPVLVFAFALASCAQGAPADQPDDGAEPDPTAQQTDAVGTDEGAGDGDAGGDATDGCLLTAEEVSTALQVEVADVTGVENPGLGAGCTYTAEGDEPLLSISMITSDQAAAAFESYQDYEGSEELSGIGDDALWLGPTFPGVAFIKEGVVVSLGITALMPVLDDDEEAQRSAVEDLARIAADRL